MLNYNIAALTEVTQGGQRVRLVDGTDLLVDWLAAQLSVGYIVHYESDDFIVTVSAADLNEAAN